MSYWDTSALVKLTLLEPDSTAFIQLSTSKIPMVTGEIGWYEIQTVYAREEAEGTLPSGETSVLSAELENDIATGKITLQLFDDRLGSAFANVLTRCFTASPPVYIRTNDALHLAFAQVSEESEFITADVRQRAAAVLLGFTVLP